MDVPAACCSLAQKVDLYICLTGRGNEHLALVFAVCFFLERGNFIDFKRIYRGDTSTRNVPGLCRKCTQPKKSLNITMYTSDRQSYD